MQYAKVLVHLHFGEHLIALDDRRALLQQMKATRMMMTSDRELLMIDLAMMIASLSFIFSSSSLFSHQKSANNNFLDFCTMCN